MSATTPSTHNYSSTRFDLMPFDEWLEVFVLTNQEKRSTLIGKYLIHLSNELKILGAALAVSMNNQKIQEMERPDAPVFPVFELDSGNTIIWLVLLVNEKIVGTAGVACLVQKQTLREQILVGLYSHRKYDSFEIDDLAADIAETMVGRFTFSGNVWVAAEQRNTPLSRWVVENLPNICRSIGVMLWQSDISFTFIRRSMAPKLLLRISCSLAVPEVRCIRDGKIQRGGHILCITGRSQTEANAFGALTRPYMGSHRVA